MDKGSRTSPAPLHKLALTEYYEDDISRSTASCPMQKIQNFTPNENMHEDVKCGNKVHGYYDVT